MHCLPPKLPLRCRLHFHKWSGYFRDACLHSGEYPWDTWQHICTRLVKQCRLCGKQRAHWRKDRCFDGGVIRLRPQPYCPPEAEIEKAKADLIAYYEQRS